MTTNLHSSTVSTEVLEHAADWIIDIQANPDLIHNRAFTQWLYADPMHLYAFEQTAKTFELAVELPKITVVPGSSASVTTKNTTTKVLNYWLAAAASMLLCAILWVVISPPQKTSNAPLAFSTEHGEVSHFSLPDNSVLHLDTASKAEVVLSSTQRQVHLIQGRLFADVAHDPTRQFRVAIDDTTAFTALGTAYSVQKSEANWTLKVYEGVVGVASTLVSHPQVEAGWGLRYHHRNLQLFRLAEALTPGLPDWQSMQVRFTNESLAEAVDKFNQYAKTAIRIDSQALATVQVSGVFDLRSPRQFAQSVSSLTGAVVVDNEGELVLKLL